MRVLLALAGVVLLGYLVADRVHQLPGHPIAGVSQSVAVAAPVPVPAVAALPTAATPPAEPQAPAQAAPNAEPRMHPVALVSLDPEAVRFPAKPSDPVSEFALVLPAPVGGAGVASESRWWQRDGGRDWTGDLTHLRLAWPGAGALSAAAAPADLPSSPASVGSIPASPAAVAAAPAGTEAAAARVASVEAPADRGLPESPATTATPAAPAAAVPAIDAPPMPVARGETSPRSAKGAARARAPLPPPPTRRLASAAPEPDISSAEGGRPSLVCSSSACGPRLLLLGVGF
jgi:hypothetical protein